MDVQRAQHGQAGIIQVASTLDPPKAVRVKSAACPLALSHACERGASFDKAAVSRQRSQEAIPQLEQKVGVQLGIL